MANTEDKKAFLVFSQVQGNRQRKAIYPESMKAEAVLFVKKENDKEPNSCCLRLGKIILESVIPFSLTQDFFEQHKEVCLRATNKYITYHNNSFNIYDVSTFEDTEDV